ncbi:MAG: amidase family protein [Rhodospirillaceae bacterium]
MFCRPLTAFALIAAITLGACEKKQEAATAPYEVEEVTLSQLSADLAAGKTTSVATTQAYIDRMKSMDAGLNAVILIAPDALEQAAAADARRKDGKSLGALDGIPILFKDNIDTKGLRTTAGSYALEFNVPEKDSTVVARLRGAGAVILGKVNTSQWAGFRTTKGLNGSTVGKGPHNPYDLSRSPAGSSSGSGIAASVSFAAATVGTDTGGSIIGPSNNNGIVGLKPTIALVPRVGIVPISMDQDSAGPMGRTVRDVAMLLNVMAGSDPADPWSAEADAHKKDYVAALSPDALKGKRIGVLRGMRGYGEETMGLFEEALGVLKGQGAELVEIPPGSIPDASDEMRIILLYSFKEDINNYLAGAPAAVKSRSLTDLIAFNDADPRESMHTSDIFEDADKTMGGRQAPEYIAAHNSAKQKTQADGFDRVLREYNVVALVNPTSGPAEVIQPDGTATSHAIKVPAGAAVSATSSTMIAGYPHLSVPMGLYKGLPVGLSFISTAWQEELLLSLGYAYEQASKKRVPPTAYKQSAAN